MRVRGDNIWYRWSFHRTPSQKSVAMNKLLNQISWLFLGSVRTQVTNSSATLFGALLVGPPKRFRVAPHYPQLLELSRTHPLPVSPFYFFITRTLFVSSTWTKFFSSFQHNLKRYWHVWAIHTHTHTIKTRK
jgi:hypothetical protein